MSAANAPRPNETRIIVGVDFGTTYSGLAWVQQASSQAIKVETLTHWPGWTQQQKVPSKISFSQSPGKKNWGFDIDVNSRIFQWTKLELIPRDPIEELETLSHLVKSLPKVICGNETDGNEVFHRHLTMRSEDVITAYLCRLAQCWYESMMSPPRNGALLLKEVPLDIVITHPVDWPHEALNKIFRAMMVAFPWTMFPMLRNVSMITEAEACSGYVVHEMTKELRNKLIRGQCFVLIDAGGGTVDAVSYLIEELEPLKLTIIGSPDGQKCGATFIDRAFLEFCSKRVNETLFEGGSTSGGHFVVTPVGQGLLNHFENWKRQFSGIQLLDIDLDEYGLTVATTNSTSSVLSLTAEDMKAMFQKCIKGTTKLIRNQLWQIGRTTRGNAPCRASTVIMAGGLSMNRYFEEQVRIYCSGEGLALESTMIQRNEDRASLESVHGWSAVVRGAVLAEAGKVLTTPSKVTKASRYYGLCVDHVYEDWKHADSVDVATSYFSGKAIAQGTITWLINQGDLVLPRKPIEREFPVRCRFSASDHKKPGSSVSIIFVGAHLDEKVIGKGPPTRLSEINRKSNTVVNLEVLLSSFNISKIPKERTADGKGSFYSVDVNVKLSLSSKIKVNVEYKGERICGYSEPTPHSVAT